MSNRERHTELLRLLRRKADWTAEQLAGELDVSRRTILRDIEDFRRQGYHIRSMTGPGGGVHLEPTSVMVTSQLDGDEVVALILSVALAEAMPGMPFASGADRALAKIEAALPQRRVGQLQRLMQRVLVGRPLERMPTDIGTIAETLVGVFEESFTNQRLLGFTYTDAGGRRTRRRVEPHGLLIRAPLWYIIAWDPGVDAARLFRADRVRSPSVSKSTFVPRPHELVTGVCPDARPPRRPPSRP